MKKISIIIPTYNRRESLKNTLLALDNQEGVNYGDYQVIVVDDGSKYFSITETEHTYKNFWVDYKYLPRNNESCRARTRNVGLTMVENDIVVLMDDDIIVRPDFLKEVIRGFSLNPGVLVVGLRKMLHHPVTAEEVRAGLIYEYPFNTEYRHQVFNHYSYNLSALKIPWNLCWTSIFAAPRIWLNHVGGLDEDYKGWGHEDIDLALRLFQAGLLPIVNYRLEGFHQPHDTGSGTARSHETGTNTELFFKKHPTDLGFTIDEFHNICQNNIMIDYSRENKATRLSEIYFNKFEQLEAIKNNLHFLSNNSDCMVNVYDELDNSNLDIWIQLLGKTPGIIKYYPPRKYREDLMLCSNSHSINNLGGNKNE